MSRIREAAFSTTPIAEFDALPSLEDWPKQYHTLGSVYHRWKGGYEQEITQNGRVHTIGRSNSLMAAITALTRFHELTGYAYAPWEEEK